MKYVKIYDSKGQCQGVADIEQNYDKAGYAKLFDSDMHVIGFVDVDNIPESGANMPFVQVFDENMLPCGVVTADNIRHSDGYLITLQKDPSTTGSVSGGGRFISGTSVTVVATPDAQSEYPEFDGWYEGATKVSENASYTFTVSGARTLVAKFKEEAIAGNVITYTANAKLAETTSTKNAGLHTNAFGDATITSHTFENGVGKINFNKPVVAFQDSAFYGCSGLTSVTIPNGVTSLGRAVFTNCSSLPSVTIPNSVTSIGDHAFEGCSGLTSVTIPNSVTSVGANAFYDCSGLISVVCNPIVAPTLGSNAFSNNHDARKIYVPAGSVDAYKAASDWSDYVNDIEAMQE